MKLPHLLIASLFFTLSFQGTFAQTEPDEMSDEPETPTVVAPVAVAPEEPIVPVVAETPKPASAQPGTYQFFVLGNDTSQLTQNDLAEKIESYRDANYIVHLKISGTTTIRILPKSEISSTSFRPLEQRVIFQPDHRDVMVKK